MVQAIRQKPKPVYCDECGTQIGEILRGDLILFSRHHGERHQTTIKKLRSVRHDMNGLDKAPGVV